MITLFKIDLKKCTACGACSVACMDQNDIQVEKGEKPFRKMIDCENISNKGFMEIASKGCLHCVDAPCISACKMSCIKKDEETNLVIYDESNCIGCKECISTCPFEAIYIDKNKKIKKCNGCIERVKNGLEPACVRVCPNGALTYNLKNEEAI